MANPIIYGPHYSTYARSVRLALEEKGVPYHLEEVDIFTGAHKTPEHMARHPFGKVPAFEHDGFTLFETGAMLRYVDEAFDGPTLQPADAHGRARMVQVLGIVDSYAYPCIVSQLFIQRVVTPMMGGTSDEEVIGEAVGSAQTCIGVLDKLLDGNRYLAGDTMTLADLHLAPVYDYLSRTPEGARLLADAPNLTRWWAEMSGRESVKTTTPKLG